MATEAEANESLKKLFGLNEEISLAVTPLESSAVADKGPGAIGYSVDNALSYRTVKGNQTTGKFNISMS